MKNNLLLNLKNFFSKLAVAVGLLMALLIFSLSLLPITYCEVTSIDPPADSVIDPSRLKNSIPFSMKVTYLNPKDFIYQNYYTKIVIRATRGPNNVTIKEIETSNKISCILICSVSITGTISSEYIDRNTITLAVDVISVKKDSGESFSLDSTEYFTYRINSEK